MPKLAANAVPSYRLHKQSGQALVTLDGRDICLGKHNTPESHQRYAQLIAEWLANGRQLPVRSDDITVAEVCRLHIWRHLHRGGRR